MQHVFIITQIQSFTSESAGQVLRLKLIDHRGGELRVVGAAQQQINIQALKNQVLPMIVMSDKLDRQVDGCLVIPEKALVSVVPIESSAVQLMLEKGKADEVLAQFMPAV